MDLISIIIPVYKAEDYLNRCVESVIMQTYPNLEIILVEDGSPDNCGALCDALARKDSRIKVIHQANQGHAGARNTGLKAAKGDYIGFLDSDDWVAPQMYQELLHTLQTNKAEVARCGYYLVQKHQIRKNFPTGFRKGTLSGKEAVLDCLAIRLNKGTFHTFVWNGLYSRASIFKPQPVLFKQELKVGEDGQWNIEVLRACRLVAYNPKPFYYHNMDNPFSITHNLDYAFRIKSLRNKLEGIKQLGLDKHPVSKYLVALFNTKIKLLEYIYLGKQARILDKRFIKDILFNSEVHFNYRLKLLGAAIYLVLRLPASFFKGI